MNNLVNDFNNNFKNNLNYLPKTTANSSNASSLVFQIEQIKFENKTNGWSALLCRDTKSKQMFEATGVFFQLSCGMVVESVGVWHAHPSYGRQWKSDSYQLIEPNDLDTLQKYLYLNIFADIKGIGKAMAAKIIKKFGKETLAIIDKTPTKLTDIKGISVSRSEKIHKQFVSCRQQSSTYLVLFKKGLSPNKINKIIELIPNETIAQLQINPYQILYKIPGFGFNTVDGLAMSFGIAKFDSHRIKAAILYLLNQNSQKDGHCYVHHRLLVSQLIELIDCKLSDIDDVFGSSLIDLCKKSLIVIIDDQSFCRFSSFGLLGSKLTDNLIYSLSKHYHQELQIAELIKQKLLQSNNIEIDKFDGHIEKFCTQLNCFLTLRQYQAVLNCFIHRFFVLTGGAGVGKTTTLKAVVHMCKIYQKDLILAAPTGRAAQRMSEVTNHKAFTIHRLLKWSPKEQSFVHNDSNKLTKDFFIIDESSMLDVELFWSFIQAISHSSTVVLVGDPNQLPSIKAGNVLKDFLQSELVPKITLNKIFRQSLKSPIIHTAQMIQRKKIAQCFYKPKNIKFFNNLNNNNKNSNKNDNKNNSTCDYIACFNNQQILLMIKHIINNELFFLDAIQDIQILTPLNKGQVGADNINSFMQSYYKEKNLLLAASHSSKKALDYNKINIADNCHKTDQNQTIIFYEGDKVIQTSNNYDLGVFNGDIGIVKSAIYRNNKINSIIVQFHNGDDVKIVEYTQDNCIDLRLGYGITMHKAQGCEFKAVIIVLCRSHQMMLSKKLLYTATTRAKNYLYFVGDMNVLAPALRKSYFQKRYTFLSKFL